MRHLRDVNMRSVRGITAEGTKVGFLVVESSIRGWQEVAVTARQEVTGRR